MTGRARPALGGQKRRPQLVERVAAEQRGQHQPVRLQGAPRLDQRARRVVGEVQRQGRDDEVHAVVAERQGLLVGDDAEPARGKKRCVPLDADDGVHLPARAQPLGHLAGMAGEIHAEPEAAVHQRQPFGELVRHGREQEARVLRGGIQRRAAAAAIQKGAVEERRGAHETLCPIAGRK